MWTQIQVKLSSQYKVLSVFTYFAEKQKKKKTFDQLQNCAFIIAVWRIVAMRKTLWPLEDNPIFKMLIQKFCKSWHALGKNTRIFRICQLIVLYSYFDIMIYSEKGGSDDRPATTYFPLFRPPATTFLLLGLRIFYYLIYYPSW